MKNSTIILLDDEPLIRLMLASALEEKGALVRDVSSCAEALEMVRGNCFDVAIFDHTLPDGNCLDLVRTMRTEGIVVRVIILSGEENRVVDEAKGIDGIEVVLPKPPDLDKVYEAVSEVLGHAGEDSGQAQRIGRYRYVTIAELNKGRVSTHDDWVVLNYAERAGAELSEYGYDYIRNAGCHIAVLKAMEHEKQKLMTLNDEIEFVDSAEELAAVSRHRTVHAERAALMRSVIQS